MSQHSHNNPDLYARYDVGRDLTDAEREANSEKRYCLECAKEMEPSDEGAICKTCDMRQLNGDQSEMGMSPDQFEREQP